MNPSRRLVPAVLALLIALVLPLTAAAERPGARPARAPKIQIALLLDNSGSMSGLLNQARTQLWRMVNELSGAKQNGVRPTLEIALYEYGEQPRMLTPFTKDLDKVSELLFGIGIAGGDEYCGQVIQMASKQLEWSGNPDDLKLIYIAGNEPFNQGPVAYKSAIDEAKRKGIVVNPIHCGGDEPTWRDGAVVAGGRFMTINHNAAVATATAPQDAELAKLSAKLNQTYVGYGSKGSANLVRQEKMDSAAGAAAPSVAAERARTKSSAAYDNSDWDLVDAVKSGKKVAALEEEALPQELRGKTVAEREAYVKAKAEERAKLQKQIATLSAARQKHLAEEQKKSAQKGDETLDQALIQSAQVEGVKRKFTF